MRFLQPLAASLWVWFLVWTALVALVWVTGFGEQNAAEWASHRFLSELQQAQGAEPGLLSPLLTILRLLDPLWIVLAAINAYASLIWERGLATARRWAAILLASGLVANLLLNALTALRFTGALGMHLAHGRISLGWILLWATVILGARELARLIFPRASHTQTGLLAGVFAVATAANLEPVATKLRVFWLWNPGRVQGPNEAPLLVYALWLIGTSALAYFFRAPEVVRTRAATPRRAAATLLILNALCLGVLLAARLRG
jgi:hypothetical protein